MWRNLAAWFVMLVVAVVNGAVRDLTYGKRLGELAAQQVSTLTGVVMLGIVMWIFVRMYPPSSAGRAWRLGLLWMGLTVAFEFLFFHYAGGRSWAELRGNYNVLEGRVWVFVLAWVAVAPYLFFRIQSHA
jgi:hypothetical protein